MTANKAGRAIPDAPSTQQVVEWLRLFRSPGEVTELRALMVTADGRFPHTEAGFFDHEHLPEMAKEAVRLSKISKGVYFTLNPLKTAILAKCYNRAKKAEIGDLAADKNVLTRKWLLIDCDPTRPVEGIPSTDEEKAAALEVAQRIRADLRAEGWPDGIFADSGNGYHLLSRVDLPADDGGLVERCLKALAQRYDGAGVLVDQKVFNPSRICKLYGTLARKGDGAEERPHRYSRVLDAPPECVVVGVELLEDLAGPAAEPSRPQAGPAPSANGHRPANGDLERAWRYIDKMPRSVSGENGHDDAFKVACKLVKRFGLSDTEALGLMRRWNADCQPPWSDKELEHKVQSARIHGHEDLGHARSPDSDRAARPTSECTTPPRRPRFALLTSADFAAADYRRQWVVRRLLVHGQPAVLGGPKKSLKTSLLVELALSLGTGTPFLGEFAVPQPARVVLLSGESGHSTLQETARRIAAAKGIELATADVLWGFDLPRLAEPADVLALQRALRDAEAEVLLLDPLYLSLLGWPTRGPSASNLYEMGPLLLAITQACLETGCTPILAHHFKLTRPNPFGEPQLDDLSYSGIQEFSRQWLLVGRREKYEPGTGTHRLWLSAGGSAGQSGLWALDIDEGVIDEEFGGRCWKVNLTTPTEARTAVQSQQEANRKADKARREQDDEAAVMKAVDQLAAEGDGVAGYTKARALSGLSGERMLRAVSRLKTQGLLREVPMTYRAGNGATREGNGLRRVDDEDQQRSTAV